MNANNKKLTKILFGAAISMFFFGFALVPLYNTLCQVVGIGGRTNIDPATYQGSQIEEREIKVNFMTHLHPDIPWEFKPEQKTIIAKPGELIEINFYAKNKANSSVIGRAVPSVAPFQTAKFFHKTECFCFQKQTLKAKEKKIMPLRFFLDKEIPKEVTSITLSYTMYNISDKEENTKENHG